MTMTEELLSKIVFAIKGSYKFKIHNEKNEEIEIDFTSPWRRVSMMEELEKVLGKKFPEDLESPETREFFDKLCVELKVPCT